MPPSGGIFHFWDPFLLFGLSPVRRLREDANLARLFSECDTDARRRNSLCFRGVSGLSIKACRLLLLPLN